MNSITVLDSNGDVLLRHASIEDAAIEILQNDSQQFRIQQDEDDSERWILLISKPVANRTWKVIMEVFADSEEEAQQKIYWLTVVVAHDYFKMTVMGDSDYDQMQRDLK